MDAWIESLRVIEPAPGGTPLPTGDAAVALLRRLGVADQDAAEILRAQPAPEAAPELWWLLERASHAFRRTIGAPAESGIAFPSLPPEMGTAGRCFWVYVFLTAVDDVRRCHTERGITEDVSWATLADLGRHIAAHRRRTGSTGLDNPFWLATHFRGLLYQLGRLQFLPYRLCTGPAGPLHWYDSEAADRLGPGFRPGDPAIGIHIPAGEPLDPAACDASLREAPGFFARHFGDTSRVMTCTSWLLDDQLAGYLAPTSNIVRFQRRFELVPGARDDDDAVLRFVFERPAESLDELPQDTELQRAIVRHLRAGKHWRLRTGWLATT